MAETYDLKLANFAEDFWELRSGEKAQAENPQTFMIPDREAREKLKRGDAAKLVFDFEVKTGNGAVEIRGEKMWVIICEKIGDFYLGILENQPAGIDPGFLDRNSEVLFKPENIIDIDSPPEDYLKARFGEDFIRDG